MYGQGLLQEVIVLKAFLIVITYSCILWFEIYELDLVDGEMFLCRHAMTGGVFSFALVHMSEKKKKIETKMEKWGLLCPTDTFLVLFLII